VLTPVEMEDRLDKLDHRLDRIEQILPMLATEDDLKGFATKDDLKAFATKDDLKALATKDDLKAYPTKADLKDVLKAYATKDDLTAFAERFTSMLAAAFEQAERNARTLHEDLVEKIKVLGEHRPKRRS
jgi:hypothetical protein